MSIMGVITVTHYGHTKLSIMGDGNDVVVVGMDGGGWLIGSSMCMTCITFGMKECRQCVQAFETGSEHIANMSFHDAPPSPPC